MAIITLQNVKDYLGITTSDEDTKLTLIVNAVNLFIPQYLNRTLEETEYEDEIYDGTGTDALCLRNFPVSEITAVSNYDIAIDARDDTVLFGYGYYMKDGGESGIVHYTNCWPRGRGNIKVSYTAGYSTIPSDIYLAALQIASFYRNVTQRPGIVSEYLGSYHVSYANQLNQMNGELTIPDIVVKNTLDRYRVSYHADIVY